MKKQHPFLVITILFSVVLSLTACLKSKDDTPSPPAGGGSTTTYNWTGIADSAQSSLAYFWNAGGKYYTSTNSTTSWTQYWPSAHALDVLTDLYLRRPDPVLKAHMLEVIEGVRQKNGGSYLNFYYDDMEWMALAALRAYKATGETTFKDLSLLLWNDIKGGWSDDLGGGIWWRKDHPSKNAPSNLPAAILAARLYKEFSNSDDLAWAKKIFQWQKSTLYDATTGLVYDNIDANGQKNTSWKFTYNQGTFTGTALELYNTTKESGYLSDAIKSADYAVGSGQLTDLSSGLLKDEGGGDGGLFKGVFVRYLTRLILDGGLESSKQQSYVSFLKSNAQKLWSQGTDKSQILFGTGWGSKPGATTDFTTQLSGIMLFEALAQLKEANLVN